MDNNPNLNKQTLFTELTNLCSYAIIVYLFTKNTTLDLNTILALCLLLFFKMLFLIINITNTTNTTNTTNINPLDIFIKDMSVIIQVFIFSLFIDKHIIDTNTLEIALYTFIVSVVTISIFKLCKKNIQNIINCTYMFISLFIIGIFCIELFRNNTCINIFILISLLIFISYLSLHKIKEK